MIVSGPKKNLHSGVDGGAVNEPMIDLVNLFAGLIDKKGKVNINGFYDHIAELSDDELVRIQILLYHSLF